jgi:hypothetical protein
VYPTTKYNLQGDVKKRTILVFLKSDDVGNEGHCVYKQCKPSSFASVDIYYICSCGYTVIH